MSPPACVPRQPMGLTPEDVDGVLESGNLALARWVHEAQEVSQSVHTLLVQVSAVDTWHTSQTGADVMCCLDIRSGPRLAQRSRNAPRHPAQRPAHAAPPPR